jgi:hypothetical protein
MTIWLEPLDCDKTTITSSWSKDKAVVWFGFPIKGIIWFDVHDIVRQACQVLPTIWTDGWVSVCETGEMLAFIQYKPLLENIIRVHLSSHSLHLLTVAPTHLSNSLRNLGLCQHCTTKMNTYLSLNSPLDHLCIHRVLCSSCFCFSSNTVATIANLKQHISWSLMVEPGVLYIYKIHLFV